jgi:uncharacterized protein (DUF433 family)
MKKDKKDKGRIVIDSNIHFGKPCIAGTRITVQDILEIVEEGILFTDIVKKYYPDIDIEDVKACVRYAADIVRAEEVHLEKV